MRILLYAPALPGHPQVYCRVIGDVLLEAGHEVVLTDPDARGAREVVAAIQAGVFWPPAEKRADRDVFALLFGADPPLIEELRAP